MSGGWWLSVYVGIGWGAIGLVWVVVVWLFGKGDERPGILPPLKTKSSGDNSKGDD